VTPAHRKLHLVTGAGCHLQLFASTPGAAVRWRLLSGNNREIARGAQTFPDADACRIAIKEMQASIDELESSVRQASAHRWIWQLTDGVEVVATSAHSYDRLIRCSSGLEHAVAALPVAEVGAGLMFSQARRWGGGIA
jgi:hypothetical protein